MRWIENRQEFLRNLHFVLTLGLALFPLLSLKATALLIVLWFVVSLSGAILLPAGPWKLRLPKALGISVIFWLLLFYFPFSQHSSSAGFELEKGLSLLIFPAGWVLWPGTLTKRQLEILFRVYVVGCFLVALLAFSHMTLGKFEIIAGDFSYSFREEFERLSSVHPTYITITFMMAIFLKMQLFLQHWKTSSIAQKLFDFVLVGFLMSIGLLLASRTPLSAFFIATPITALFTLSNRKIALWGILGAGILGIVLFTQFPSIRSRISEMNPSNMRPPEGGNYNSVNVRTGILICANEILQEHWLLGVGTGGVQPALNECYEKFQTAVYKSKDYNAHNQFVHYWLSAGLPGLFAFLFVIFYPLYLAYRYKKSIPFFFLFFFLFCCLTENLLARQMGVVFFTFFNALFLFNMLSPPPKDPSGGPVDS